MPDGAATALVRTAVVAHVPTCAREIANQATMLAYLAWLPRPLDEHADPVHVTGSAVVLDGRGRTLLHRHKRLDRWLQPGGHIENGESPWQAAQREAREETGIPLHATEIRLVHLDIHEAGRGHLHLDLRYVFHGDGDAEFLPAPGESRQLRWVAIDQVDRWSDASLVEAVAAVRRRGDHLTT